VWPGLQQLAATMNIRPEKQDHALPDANTALIELKSSKIRAAKVLRMN
jgi:hypothetical protein